MNCTPEFQKVLFIFSFVISTTHTLVAMIVGVDVLGQMFINFVLAFCFFSLLEA